MCEGVQRCLLHPHSWVRLLAAQLLGLYLTRRTEHPDLAWIQDAAALKSCVLDSFEQLSLAETVDGELSLQVVKNLVALTRLILSLQEENLDLKDENLDHQDQKIDLCFALKRAVKLSNQELIHSPTSTVRRTLVFNYIAAVCLQSTEQQLQPVLKLILTPLQREVSNSKANPELKTHTQEVLDLIKTKMDDELFSKTLLEIQLDISKKRQERTANRKQNLILHPNVAAKRKIQQNEAKRSAKKARRLHKA